MRGEYILNNIISDDREEIYKRGWRENEER